MFCELNLRGVTTIERYPNIFPQLQVTKQPCEIGNKNFDMLNTPSEIRK